MTIWRTNVSSVVKVIAKCNCHNSVFLLEQCKYYLQSHLNNIYCLHNTCGIANSPTMFVENWHYYKCPCHVRLEMTKKWQ
jgi:hypothetical protein